MGEELATVDNARVSFRDASQPVKGLTVEIYPDWVHVVDEDEWLPRDTIQFVTGGGEQ